jgi:RNA polymerase sigma-70 factor, ECF subfamily
MDESDRALMGRMALGDQEALSELMRRHHHRVYRLALAYLRDPDDAVEVVQEAFVKAFRAAARWDGTEVAPWLNRIAINESIDRYRRKRRRRAVEEPLDTDAAAQDGRWAAAGPSPERRVFGRELGDRIGTAVAALPERQRAIFVLRHYQEMELADIARALDMRLGTVKSGLHRALERLRVLLAGVRP